MNTMFTKGDRVIETRFPETTGTVIGVIRLVGVMTSEPIVIIRWDQTDPRFVEGAWLSLDMVSKVGAA